MSILKKAAAAIAPANPVGELIDRKTEARTALAPEAIRLIMKGWELRKQLDEVEAKLKGINAELLAGFDSDASLVVHGVCRASIAERETIKITDANKLRGVLGERFDDLVQTSVNYKAEPKLLDLACSADDPLAPAIRACLAASLSRSVTWRAEK